MEKISRRGYCRLGLLGTAGSFAGCSSLPEPEPNALEVDIVQSTRMRDTASNTGQSETHALDVIQKALELSLGDLAERADGFGAVEVTRTEEPVDTSRAFNAAQSLQAHKQIHAESEVVDKSIHSALLVDAFPSNPFGAAGMAEDHGGDNECSLKEDPYSGSTYSVMQDGEKLLSIAPDDVKLEEPVETDYSPAYGALALAVHEVGHNLCLHHSHGRITRQGGTVLISPMIVGYSVELAGQETACGGTNADIETEDRSTREVDGIGNETVTFRNFNTGIVPTEPLRVTLRFSECSVEQL